MANGSTRMTRRSSTRIHRLGRRIDGRHLIGGLLVAVFLLAQGAALAHAHGSFLAEAGSHDGPCAVCRVAGDADDALQVTPPCAAVRAFDPIASIAPAPGVATPGPHCAHAPRAPPIV